MGLPDPFIARTEARNGVARIALGGELDLATTPILGEQLQDAEQLDVDAIVLDLRDVTFIDSTGLAAFIRARERASRNGHRFLLVGANDSARRLFELTGTQTLLDAEDTASIVARFTRGHPSVEGEAAVADLSAGG
jgi:anti-anti-sigma factor